MGYNCYLSFGKYSNDRIGFELLDEEDAGCVAIATINMPEVNVKSDEVIIKDYSENDGMLDILVEAGVVSEPLRFVASGFISAPVCKLLVTPNEKDKKSD